MQNHWQHIDAIARLMSDPENQPPQWSEKEAEARVVELLTRTQGENLSSMAEPHIEPVEDTSRG